MTSGCILLDIFLTFTDIYLLLAW